MKTKLQNLFITVHNFPINDFDFPDITPIIERDPLTFKKIIDHLTNFLVNKKIDYIVCIESFGYVFGIPIAYNLGCKVILARKPGKLPRDTVSSNYKMIYDPKRSIEIHSDVIKKGDSVVIIDDFLASGGTARAVMDILYEFGAKISESLFIVELPELNGRDILKSRCNNIYSLIDMNYDSIRKVWNVYETRIK